MSNSRVKVIADTSDRCLDYPVVIQKILEHLQHKAEINESSPLPDSRASPAGLFD